MGYLSRSYDSKTGGDLSLIILRGSNDSMTRGLDLNAAPSDRDGC